jgi:hypothetical protein
MGQSPFERASLYEKALGIFTATVVSISRTYQAWISQGINQSLERTLTLWPLQVLFHNIAWHLACEEFRVGQEHGLIRTERLDRLHWIGVDGSTRWEEEVHNLALQRLEWLLQVCGGIYPYPVEIDLPIWTLEQDRDLQAWLFRFGAGIRIEKPESLRELHQRIAEKVVTVYGETP